MSFFISISSFTPDQPNTGSNVAFVAKKKTQRDKKKTENYDKQINTVHM